MPEPYSKDGCLCVMVLLACWFVFCVLAALAFFVSDCTGLEFETILGWLFGTVLAVVVVIGLIVAPLVRFVFLVMITAVLLIALLTTSNDGNQEIMDKGWAKAFVAIVSTGVGGVYLLWETSRSC